MSVATTPEEQIIDYVGEHEGVSFVELEELLSDSIEIHGEGTIVAPKDPKVHFWVNMSERFVEAVQNVLESGEVHIHPCQPFVYAVDGKAPALDLVKRPPEDGYATDRWFPVAFCTYPVEERDDWPDGGTEE